MTDYLTNRPKSIGEAWGRIIQMNGEIERRNRTIKAGVYWRQLLGDGVTALKAELTKYQESEFHPDWSMLEATRGLLREHKAELKAAREQIAELQDDRKYQEPYLRAELEKAWKIKVELRDENQMLADSARIWREDVAKAKDELAKARESNRDLMEENTDLLAELIEARERLRT